MTVNFDYCEGFEWDEGNSDKNWDLYQVSKAESEEVFFNVPLILAGDTKHSKTEKRYYVLGQTDRGRLLFVVFTTRYNFIRVISARDMNQREPVNMKDMSKDIPTFESEDEEREFWATHDSTEYVDWDKASPAYFPKLKPSTKSISLRLPEMMLIKLRLIANKRDVPYQSLIKVFLYDRINQELKHLDRDEDASALERVEANGSSPVEASRV